MKTIKHTGESVRFFIDDKKMRFYVKIDDKINEMSIWCP